MTARRFDVGRHDFLMAAAGLGALPLLGCAPSKGSAVRIVAPASGAVPEVGRRSLGALELSSLGPGCSRGGTHPR